MTEEIAGLPTSLLRSRASQPPIRARPRPGTRIQPEVTQTVSLWVISRSLDELAPQTLTLGRLPHRLVDHLPVVPLRLTLQVLEHLPVLAVHVGAVRVLPVRLFALEDHAQPDLVRILCAAAGRFVDPARGRIILEWAKSL